MKTVKDFDVKDKRVLVRCDFNVPLGEGLESDFRIRQALPSIRYLVENKAKVILMSHLGRPEGIVSEDLRLAEVHNRLEDLLGFSIDKTSDCIGEEAKEKAKNLKEGEVLLLENLRFHKEEEENNKEFAKELASLGEIYINDAFGVCHREQASVSAITDYLPSGAGLLLEKEVDILSSVMKNPARPFISLIGGVKFESKAKVIGKFLESADLVLVGGKIGLSEEVRKVGSPKLVLPIDNLDTFDIGPKTIELFSEKIKTAKTIVWAGPVGLFEEESYSAGTRKLGEAIISNTQALKVAGGGDTVSAIFKFNLQDSFNHLSTGGGAMLEFVAGEKLPGLEVLGYYK